MSGVPEFALSLLSVPADDFVHERRRLVRKLREEGRREEAATVAALRKPPPVVLAANRAARSRPKVAKAAASAATKMTMEVADAAGRRELDDQLALMEEVALAFLVGEGTIPSESTRRRLRDLLRNAMADEDTREALARGVLTDEPEPAGFAAYSTMPKGTSSRARSRAMGTAAKRTSTESRAEAAEATRRERERAQRKEVDAAEARLDAAKEAEVRAAKDRARAERELASARGRLDQLSRRQQPGSSH